MPREAFAAALTKGPEAAPARAEAGGRTASPAQQRVLALQRAAGNRAVAQLVAAGKRPPGVDAEDEFEVPVGGWFGDLWKKRGSASAAAGAAAATAAAVTTPLGPVAAAAASAVATAAAAKPKLSKSVVSAPAARDCGGWNWVIQWKLDKPSTTGGWIVQRVDARRDVKDASGAAVPVTNGWDPAWTPYWEGWKVNPGKSVTTYAETGDLEDDTYAGTAGGDNTKGSFTMTGHADFYEGATLPATMTPTNAAPAWILPFTKTDPSLPGGTGAIAHDLTATWDCTGTTKSTTITTR